MEIVRELDNYKKSDSPLYLALGNFDGVHRGHKKLINDLVEKAKKNNGVAAAFIFEPHPAKVLKPDKAPKLLVTPERKAELLDELGLDILIYNTFNTEISRCSPEEFVERILVDKFEVKEVFVGFNHSFGYKGAGTPELLRELGGRYNFAVNIISPVKIDGQVVSSSLIRQALDAALIENAYNMLGYYPMLEGVVIKGESRGGTIGFPTANLGVSSDLNVPGKGVYAARAQVDNQYFNCVVNIGNKPTFHENYPVSIEAHLLNFQKDIYGKSLRVHFVQKIREQRKFESIDELIRQIELDCKVGEKIISSWFSL